MDLKPVEPGSIGNETKNVHSRILKRSDYIVKCTIRLESGRFASLESCPVLVVHQSKKGLFHLRATQSLTFLILGNVTPSNSVVNYISENESRSSYLSLGSPVRPKTEARNFQFKGGTE